MGEKTQNGFQWAAVLSAIAVMAQQLTESGVVQPEQGMVILTITTLFSAFLPKIRGRLKK